jgi:hypothetical protein
MLADAAAIEQVARGLDIMMPEAIDLKFIAAPLTSNQLKEGRGGKCAANEASDRIPGAQKSVAMPLTSQSP